MRCLNTPTLEWGRDARGGGGGGGGGWFDRWFAGGLCGVQMFSKENF